MTEQSDWMNLYKRFSYFSDEYKAAHPLVFNYVQRVTKDMVLYYEPFDVINPDEVSSLEVVSKLYRTNGEPGECRETKELYAGQTCTGKKILTDKYGAMAVLDMFARIGGSKNE